MSQYVSGKFVLTYADAKELNELAAFEPWESRS